MSGLEGNVTVYSAGAPVAMPSIDGTALSHLAANPAIAGAATLGVAVTGLAILSTVGSIFRRWFGSPEPGRKF